MDTRTRVIGLVVLLVWTLCIVGNVIAGDVKTELDANLKKTVDGFTVKDWLYKPGSHEFVFYVADGEKWRNDYIRTGGLPKHAIIPALSAGLIIEQHPEMVPPQTCVFKDGGTELFRLDQDYVAQKLKEAACTEGPSVNLG